MRIASLAIGLGISAVIAVAAGPSAHAQTKNKQNQQPKKAAKVTSVVINPGDTLTDIATKYNTNYQRLYDANTDISDPDLIYVGETVRIPDVNEQLANRELPVKVVPVAVPAATAATIAPASSQSYAAPAPAPAPAPVAQSAPVTGCGDNQYANYIYMHESGCRTTASNAGGCYGIGQACPGSKIAYCGSDYACQNAFFTNYANKYGGWAGAYAFWTSHGWW